MSDSEVSVEEIYLAVMKFFNRKDTNRTGQLVICGVKYPRGALKVWLRSMLEEGVQILRISAGISMVHGHRSVQPSDIKQAFRIHKEGSEQSVACNCQQENIDPK